MQKSSKKSQPKSSRLSRLIARMQSPKQATSLVLETGFPTSLIDLFVKNSYRLKKKKTAQMKISETRLLSSPLVPEKCVTEDDTSREVNGEVFIGGIKCIEFKNDEKKKKKNNNNNVVGDNWLKNVFCHVFKMLFVVVFWLSTRKLAVGITLSAFLLMFFEYVGRRIDLNRNGSRSKGIGICLDEDKCSGAELRPREEEIKVSGKVGSDRLKRTGIVEVPISARLSDCWSEEVIGQGVIKELIEEDVAEFSKDKKKAKKFIGKVLNRLKSMKKKKGKEAYPKGDCRYDCTEEGCDKELKEEDDGGGRLSISSRKQGCCGKMKEQKSEIHSSVKLCMADAEMSTSEDNVGKGREKKSGYLIVFIVVLAGLLGGRMLGLLITIAWCILLKFVCKLRGHVDNPLVKINSKL